MHTSWWGGSKHGIHPTSTYGSLARLLKRTIKFRRAKICVSQIMSDTLRTYSSDGTRRFRSKIRSKFWLPGTHYWTIVSYSMSMHHDEEASIHTVSVQPPATYDGSVVPRVRSTVEHNTVCWYTCAIQYTTAYILTRRIRQVPHDLPLVAWQLCIRTFG